MHADSIAKLLSSYTSLNFVLLNERFKLVLLMTLILLKSIEASLNLPELGTKLCSSKPILLQNGRSIPNFLFAAPYYRVTL